MKGILSLTLAFFMTLGLALQMFPKAVATEENLFDTYGWKLGTYDATQNTSTACRYLTQDLQNKNYFLTIPIWRKKK